MVVSNYSYTNTIFDLTDDGISAANLERKILDPGYLDHLISEGEISEKNKIELISMMANLEETYPDHWDIQISKIRYNYTILYDNSSNYGASSFTEKRGIYKLCFDIIIHYPEFVISNGRNRHTIRDLYVKSKYFEAPTGNIFINGNSTTQEYLNLNPEINQHNGFYVKFNDFSIQTYIQGLRGSLTEAEYIKGYLHSHLGGRTDYKLDYGNFCLGTGEINQTLMLLKAEFSSELYQLFLLQLDAYVRWESLAGVPHMRINEIPNHARLSRLPSLRIAVIESFLRTLKYYWRNGRSYDNNTFMDRLRPLPFAERIPKLNWKVIDGRTVIIDDEQFDRFLRIYDDPYDYPANIVLYQDTEGYYYGIACINTGVVRANITRKTFVFKGEAKSLGVITEVESNINENFIFHPKIKEVVKQELEAYGNNNKIKTSLNERATQIAHSRRAIQQDQISLQENQQS